MIFNDISYKDNHQFNFTSVRKVLQINQRGKGMFKTLRSPLALQNNLHLLRFLVVFFVFDRLFNDLFLRNTATTAVVFFLCHLYHLLSV